MIRYLNTQFSGSQGASRATTGQPITVTAISTNVLDSRNLPTPALVDDGLLGGELWLIVQAVTAAAGGDAAKTLTVTLESDSTADLATSPTVHEATSAIAGAAITAGAILLRAKVPSGDYERYLGLRYTCSATFTSFSVVAFLTPDPQRNVAHAVGFAVL